VDTKATAGVGRTGLERKPPASSELVEVVSLELCQPTNTHTGPGGGGYIFQSPVEMCLVGLRVPNIPEAVTQQLQVLVFPTQPQAKVVLGDGYDFMEFHEPSAPIGEIIVPPNGGIQVAAGSFVAVAGSTSGSTFASRYPICAGTGFGIGFEVMIGPTTVQLDSFQVFLDDLTKGYTYFAYGDSAITSVDLGDCAITPVEFYYTEGPCGACLDGCDKQSYATRLKFVALKDYHELTE